jgi:hypothetical protein
LGKKAAIMVSDLRQYKKSVSARILSIQGVTGVGIPQGKLTVYLQQDLPGVRQKVLNIVAPDLSAEEVQFIESGEFHAQNDAESAGT